MADKITMTREIAIRIAGTNAATGATETYTLKLPNYKENSSSTKKASVATLLEPYLRAKFIAADASTDTTEFATLFWNGSSGWASNYFTEVDQVTLTEKTVTDRQ